MPDAAADRYEELAGEAVQPARPMEETPRRNHVLFVTVDQWPARLLGIAGHLVVETPTLDQIARVGTRYTNAYAECPICIPARRSMMTGTSPRGHGDREFQPALPMPAQKLRGAVHGRPAPPRDPLRRIARRRQGDAHGP